MSSKIDWFASDAGLFVASEYPSNDGSITLTDINGRLTLTIYLPVNQWWALRTVFPKHTTYVFHTSQHYSKDWNTADRLAGEFYRKYGQALTQQAAPLEVAE